MCSMKHPSHFLQDDLTQGKRPRFFVQSSVLSIPISPTTVKLTSDLISRGFSRELLLAPLPWPEDVNTEETVISKQKSLDSWSSERKRKEGEKRLIINFHSYGKIGKTPQTCGRNNYCFIPDGIIGTHTFYDEKWKFEIYHTEERVKIAETINSIINNQAIIRN